MVNVNEVTKVFGDKVAVNRISFGIKEGDIFGFLGPNGAGKTTTIRMMIGLLEPTSGEIYINGKHSFRNRQELYRDIGIVFELPNLYMKMSIQKNLQLFARIYQLPNQRVIEVMEDLQLMDQRNKVVEKLSKGWKQRVLIGRALLHKPKVLILDEPTSGLDPNTATLIRQYIRSLHDKGTTIILTTHDMNEADELCNRVGIMDCGEIKAIGTPQELKARYERKEVKILYTDEENIREESRMMDDEKTKVFLKELIDEGRLLRVNPHEVSLADVFYEITGGQLS